MGAVVPGYGTRAAGALLHLTLSHHGSICGPRHMLDTGLLVLETKAKLNQIKTTVFAQAITIVAKDAKMS